MRTFSIFSTILFITILSMAQFHQLDVSYFNSLITIFSLYKFSFAIDIVSLRFINIVFPVTMFVLFFRKFYISNYNNQKFILILLLFFLSILILCTRNSALSLMIGWDGLGLTSICLIIFYPNKTSAYNSILTIFFNRLGDVFIIVALRLILSNYAESLLISYDWRVLLIMIVCAFRKRAQFPLSRWLPAAISAPTPISAIVHSSTLVTAGVFLMNKIESLLLASNFLLPLILGSLTFLIGGILANIEKDFKKIVAFSTMRQIRIIIIFCITIRFWGSLTHMIFHAFFKTSLFCCCGLIFVQNFRTQNKSLLTSNSNQNTYFLITFLRVFSMTGLIFSSSFFRKDLFLEEMLYSNFNFFSVIVLTGRIMTLFYCCYLLTRIKKFRKLGSTTERKIMNSYRFICFLLITMASPFFFKTILLLEIFPIAYRIEIILLTLIFITSIFIWKKFEIQGKKSVRSIFFIKEYTYSLLRNFFANRRSKETFMRDIIFFKPNLFLSKRKIKVKEFSPIISLGVIVILTLII